MKLVETGMRPRPERTISVHFPKAAGSSLKLQLEVLLGDGIALDYSCGPLTSRAGETTDFPSGKLLVYGHFRAQRYANTAAYWMTFLRHPVDNLISIYFFWKDIQQPGHMLHDQFLRESPSILEFAKYPAFTNLMSETYFGGFDMSRFAFVGFYENRGADLPRLAADLGLPLKADIYENRTAPSVERRELEADVSIRRQLTNLLAADVTFYEQMRRQHGSFPSLENS
jgi:hypothetical protein